MTPPKIALQRIEECRRTCSTELDLSGLGLEEIPEQMFELTWLEKLDVSGDRLNHAGREITHIPTTICKLKSLTEFKCSMNRISDISPLAELTQLQKLECKDNLTFDLYPLRSLTSLQVINISGGIYESSQELANFSILGSLSQLQVLHCDSLNINDLSVISDLFNLKELSCNATSVRSLSPLSKLAKLQTLYISGLTWDKNGNIKNLLPLENLINLELLERLAKSDKLSCSISSIDRTPHIQSTFYSI